jgi:HEPN domain-containing protein
MSKSNATNSKDLLERRVNDFACRSFRDMADRDYIAARLACRAELLPQFLWSAQQAIEKYLKYILLVNRIPATTIKHDIKSALALTSNLSFKIDLRARSKAFLEHVATYGVDRYLGVSYHVEGPILFDLDVCVWELRRYCQVLDVFGKKLPTVEQEMLNEAWAMLNKSNVKQPLEFHLPDGVIEKILASKKHPARRALIWQNAFFGQRKRSLVKARTFMHGENSPLSLYPDMIEELLKYVFVEDKTGWRKHLEAVHKDPSLRL